GDVQIFVHAAADRSADDQSERARGDGAIRGRNPSIGEIDPRRVVGDCTAIEEVPGLAIGIDGPTADDACIKEIKALLAWPIDLPIWLTDQHCLSLMDRDLMGTDLNLERHVELPWLRSRRVLSGGAITPTRVLCTLFPLLPQADRFRNDARTGLV